jgi:hypothetical protein
MFPSPLLPLIDWNPQFFREVKGRFRAKNVGLAIAGSFALQAIIFMLMWASLPASLKDEYNRYCIKSTTKEYWLCALDAAGNVMINWQRWWLDLFLTLTWLVPMFLLVAGTYQLIADLAREERRGTLNFLRLSPQTSQTILMGKILGVPLISVLVAIAVIPLHLWAAANAGVSAAFVGSIYLVILLACGFFYTAAVLYALMGKAHAWLGAAAVWFSYSILFLRWQDPDYTSGTYFLGPHQWYFLPISQSLLLTVLFAGMIFILGTAACWKAINRRYRYPSSTLVSKRHSYLLTLGFELFLLGFVIRYNEAHVSIFAISELTILMIVNTIWFLVLMVALTPQRQTLLDWARYRHASNSQHHAFPQSLKRDLLWGEKSPALVAIALNILISVAVLTPWILTWQEAQLQTTAFLGLLFNSLFLLICAALIQSTVMMKTQKRVLALSILLLLPVVILPLFLFTLRYGMNDNQAMLWFFSAFALPGIEKASMTAIAFGLLAHLAALTTLLAHSTRQLRQAGKSELKALISRS